MEQEFSSAWLEEMRRLMEENPPPENLLPILFVFSHFSHRDEQTGRATMHFDVVWGERADIPDKVRMIIRSPRKEVFNQEVELSPLPTDQYPERIVRRATVELGEVEFAQIYNNPDAEVTFVHGEKESNLLIYV